MEENNENNLDNNLDNNKNNLDNNEILDEQHDGVPDDWFGKHKIFTRLMVFAISAVFVYSFVLPLPIAYAEMASYIMIFALMVITFGLNSLKIIGSLITKWKK